MATLGVGLGILLINSVENLSTVPLYLGTALFLSLGLDPSYRSSSVDGFRAGRPSS